MKTEKSKEFKKYFDEAISENGPDVFGSRMILNNGSSEQIETFSNVLKLPEDEEIIVFFDDTIKGSGKGGLAFTSWGVRYKDNAAQKKWGLSWEELGENYTFHKEGLINKKLMLHNDKGNLFTVDKEICLSFASFEIKWLETILLNGCVIMNGKDPYAASGGVQGNESKNNTVNAVENAQEPEPDTRDDNKDSEIKHREDNTGSRTVPLPPSNSKKKNSITENSFIRRNIGWVIFSIVTVIIRIVIAFVMAKESNIVFNKFLYIVMAVFLHIPVVFIACMIGKAIRDAIHPDFIFADGFFGLLKEKIFWKIGPQTIAAIIAVILASNLTFGLCVNEKASIAARQVARQEAELARQTAEEEYVLARQKALEEASGSQNTSNTQTNLNTSEFYYATGNLRLRSEPDTSVDNRITSISEGDAVELLEIGRPDTIDGITAPWVKVKTSDGSVGWVFSGYLNDR